MNEAGHRVDQSEPESERTTILQTPTLAVEEVIEDTTRTLVLTGELDLAARPVMDEFLANIGAQPTSAIVLDLSKLTFICSRGVSALLEAKELCAERDVDLSILLSEGKVRRVLDMTHALDVLPVRDA